MWRAFALLRAWWRTAANTRKIMLYLVETQVDTPSTLHFKSFLKRFSSKVAEKNIDRSASMASRSAS